MLSGMKPVLKWLRLLQKEESTLVVRLFATKYVQNLNKCLAYGVIPFQSEVVLPWWTLKCSEQCSVVSWVPETLVLLSCFVEVYSLWPKICQPQAHTESAFCTQEKSSSTHVICHSNIFLVLSNFITDQAISGESYNDWDIQSLALVQGGFSLCNGL